MRNKPAACDVSCCCRAWPGPSAARAGPCPACGPGTPYVQLGQQPALFDSAVLAALKMAEALRDAETARALARRLNTLHLQERGLEVDVTAIFTPPEPRAGACRRFGPAHRDPQFIHDLPRGDGAATSRDAVAAGSTAAAATGCETGVVDATRPPPHLLAGAPRSARTADRHNAALEEGAQSPEPESSGQLNAVAASTGVSTTASSGTPTGAGLSGKPLMRVAIGYAVADANLPRLARAVDRAHRALAAIGQRRVGCVLVTDDGATVSLQHWLPADVVVLPRRGPGGFPAAHGRMMEVAFAQGADAYVLTETRARFNETVLAASLSALAAHGSEGVFAVGADLDPVMDPVSPAFLVITRGAAARLGPIDARLDAPCGLLDLYLRAEMQGINVFALAGPGTLLRYEQSGNAGRLAAGAPRLRRCLGAGWKVGLQPLTAQLRSAYGSQHRSAANRCQRACRTRRRVSLRGGSAAWPIGPAGTLTQLEPLADQAAVLPPAELDASLAVPLSAVALRWTEAGQRVAAIVNLCDVELGQQAFDMLTHIPARCDLFITTDTDANGNSLRPCSMAGPPVPSMCM